MRKKRQAEIETRQAAVAELLDRHGRLRTALTELSSLDAAHFRVSAQVKSESVLPPEQLRLISASLESSSYSTEVRELNVEQLKRTVERGEGVAANPSKTTAMPTAELAKALLLRTTPTILAGRSEFVPTSLSDIGFILAPSATQTLSKGTQAILKKTSD